MILNLNFTLVSYLKYQNDEKTNINNSFLIIRKYELIEKLVNNKNCNLVHSVYPQK